MTLNYGISQFLPVSQTVLGKLGVLGYGQWQVTRDSGSDAVNKSVKDRVYGLGFQGSLTYLPWKAQLSFHWLHEFEAEDRFEGDYFVLTLAASFKDRRYRHKQGLGIDAARQKAMRALYLQYMSHQPRMEGT